MLGFGRPLREFRVPPNQRSSDPLSLLKIIEDLKDRFYIG